MLIATPPSHASSEWTIHKINGRDYVTLGSIARFYGLPTDYTVTNKSVFLHNQRNQIEAFVNSREIGLNGVRHWLAYPVLLYNDEVIISRLDLAKTLEPALRPNFVKELEPFHTVVIDPGHGGSETGAASRFGTEKDANLDTAIRLKKLLEANGFDTVMTRDRDVTVSLEERARIANEHPNAIFVSIHYNGAANTAANGAEIFSLTPRGAPSTMDTALRPHHLAVESGTAADQQSFLLAGAVHHSVVGSLNLFDRGHKRARFAVLRLTKIPSILVEGGFMSNSLDARQIASAAWRQRLATAIYRGIENYSLLARERKRPMQLADYRKQSLTGVGLRESNYTAPRVIAPGAGSALEPPQPGH